MDALDATGQTKEAQRTRSARFERHLSISRLRGYARKQIRRFGKYDLDMDDLPAPLVPRSLPFDLPC
ncbi:hypothetical protein [Rhizobium ruizarguesonis]|uniref:hypothetical protein n=1 Tax=Rhizobium ruizarguesonis TaxID=2081791 RepID=UPI0038576E00